MRSLRAPCARSLLALLVLLTVAVGSARSDGLTTEPIRWFDADNRDIPEPAEVEENQVWDIVDHTFFYQVGKVLDLGWTARRLGNLLHLAPPREADNTNALGEVPNSSWYTNRHHLRRLSREELASGPGHAVPDQGGPWEIIAGKFEGGTAGFTILDASGTGFLLKFDSEGNNEMGSAAEVIATKLLHAAGYNVPRNSVVYFHPSLLRIGSKAMVPVAGGGKRPMNHDDMQGILDNIIPQPDGRLRCVASQFLKGGLVGPFNYDGRRPDDPNDRVDHQHRRELRALRVIGSWMNDADRRAANSLDVWVSEEGGARRYLRHFIIDMGSAFGSNNLTPHMPKYGNEYVWDPRTIARSIFSLGLYRKPWEEPLPMAYPEIGYFENETFDPNRWVPTYPNPAMERCTLRDAYWGAKIVMSFSDDDVRAMVEQGRYADAGATDELTRLLVERRDIIGRYWFARVNPLDRFSTDRTGLHFVDLAVKGGLETPAGTEYQYLLLDEHGGILRDAAVTDATRLPVPGDLTADSYYSFEIRTRRGAAAPWSKSTRAHFHKWGDGRLQLVRVERDT